jgi:hypothetical protein
MVRFGEASTFPSQVIPGSFPRMSMIAAVIVILLGIGAVGFLIEGKLNHVIDLLDALKRSRDD